MSYLPIKDYAIIGDCHGAALVSRDGSIDWCTLGRFDSDPVFCRILDAHRGGHLSVQPGGSYETSRHYLRNTNILQTTFTTSCGKLAVTDFMPVGRAPGAGVHDYVTLNAPFWLVRLVECLEGKVTIKADYKPTVDFARRPANLFSPSEGYFSAEAGLCLHTDAALNIRGDNAGAELELRTGEQKRFVVTPTPIAGLVISSGCERLLQVTRAFWEEWSDYCRYSGPHLEHVMRSALVLKLLTYAPTGAIVAAPTTSLPEGIGGVRNWDYRYCWLRDSTFILYSLAVLGYSGEARKFGEFLTRVCHLTKPRLRIMYGIGRETELYEVEMNHLEGYRGSRPVRTGNGAFDQQQLDIYGEVLDWAHLYRTLGGKLDSAQIGFLESLAEFVTDNWNEPDPGIWEMRGAPKHHVHGKIMCWVTVDRAIRLFGKTRKLTHLRDTIFNTIMSEGTSRDNGHLVQAYGESAVDASLLMAPIVGFPLEPSKFRRTVEVVERELRRGNYLMRYNTADGLEGDEGAFLICSFWLVDALLFVGRAGEAKELFSRLLECANDVGLYSEEIDPDTNEFLGNFPQAFTHLALILNAAHLELYGEQGPEALKGSHADRARRSVEATAGPGAVWAAFKKSGRVGRVRSSRKSVMPDNPASGSL